MEKNFGLGFLPGFPISNGHLNTDPDRRYHHAVEDSVSKNAPFIPNFGFQQSKASEENKSLNWVCHKPHFQQAFTPSLNEMFPLSQSDIGLQRSPTTGIIPSRKRFLVFDQSGDKTTLLYSSMVHTPSQFGAYRAPTPLATHNLSPSRNDENIEDNSRDVTEDEMREDSEELDALLWSDNDSDSIEDDETSTGHSPSTVSDNAIPKLVEETGEEVDSFPLSPKRRKLLDDAASNSCLKTFACSELESDAELSCGGDNEHNEESYPMPGCKRSRREKIYKTVSILQSIIPDANEKDAIAVIDRAIHYLRSLKVKAKALGLDAI